MSEIKERERFNRSMGKYASLKNLSPEARRWVEQRIRENEQRISDLTS